jgi:hypothetical protein
MDGSDIGSDQSPRRDTPGGPITGNQVVPCSWQKSAQGGPMIVASDMTGIEPASRAWEPCDDAQVQGLTCGQTCSGVTLADRC